MPAQQQAGFDNRRAKRRELERTGFIVTGDGEKLCCVVNDVSQTGARLSLDGAVAVPPRFVLILSANGKVRRFCELVWCRSTELGVRFLQPNEASTDNASADNAPVKMLLDI